jgi:hypothetical protein
MLLNSLPLFPLAQDYSRNVGFATEISRLARRRMSPQWIPFSWRVFPLALIATNRQ